MKKFLALILATLLIVALAVPVFAEETEELPFVEEIETTEEIPAAETSVVDEVTAYISEMAHKLTDTQFWAGLGIDITLLLAIFVFLKKTTANISGLFSTSEKVTDIKLSSIAKTVACEVSDLKTLLETMQDRLTLSEEQNKKLLTVISLMATCQRGIPATCKADILALLSKEDTTIEDVCETVKAVTEEIKQAEEEAKEETPALTAIAEEEHTMNLG